jgi:hypothetical protein
MSERRTSESLGSTFVSGHGPVISKVDRYLKVSHQSQGQRQRARKGRTVKAKEFVMDSFSVPKLCLGHPTKGFARHPTFPIPKGRGEEG